MVVIAKADGLTKLVVVVVVVVLVVVVECCNMVLMMTIVITSSGTAFNGTECGHSRGLQDLQFLRGQLFFVSSINFPYGD